MMVKQKTVCWNCRISLKAVAKVCTRCGGEMTLIGKNLRAPQISNKKGWKKLKEYVDRIPGYLPDGSWNRPPSQVKVECRTCKKRLPQDETSLQHRLCFDCNKNLNVWLDRQTIPKHRTNLCCLVASKDRCSGCRATLCTDHVYEWDACPSKEKVRQEWIRKNKVKKTRCAYE